MALPKRVRSFFSFVFTLVVVGAAVIAVKSSGILVNNASEAPSTSPQIDSSGVAPSGSTTGITSESPSGSASIQKVVTLNQTGGKSNIQIVDPETKQRSTIFTDADETLKIKQIGNITADGKEILIILGNAEESFGGSLYSISTSGKGEKTQLISEFASPWPPVLSPDGKKIVYVLFTNTNNDSGFYLIVANRDGSNKREIVKETQPITQPIFSPDGNRIAYFKEKAPKGGSIMSISVSGGEAKEVISYTDRVPYDLTWGSDDTLAMVDGTGEAADIYELKSGTSELAKLTTPSGSESRPVYSSDGKWLAFASTKGTETSIYLYNREKNQSELIGSGRMAIGFINVERSN